MTEASTSERTAEYVRSTTLDDLRLVSAGTFLALFVGVWVWIAVELLRFHPTPGHPQLDLGAAFTTVSGVVSGAVGATTAAALGINVQQTLKNAPGGPIGLSQAVKQPTNAPLVVVGVLSYLLVGLLLVVVWLAKGGAAPEVVQSFSVGALGWLAGAFAAVFAPSSHTSGSTAAAVGGTLEQ
jgi:hypothetical protein